MQTFLAVTMLTILNTCVGIQSSLDVYCDRQAVTYQQLATDLVSDAEQSDKQLASVSSGRDVIAGFEAVCN